MHFRLSLYTTFVLGVLVQSISAHGVLTAVTGANGVNGEGFGVDNSTPRDGSLPRPFEQDTSVFKNIKQAPCGQTKIGGVNDVTAQVAAASSAGLPSVASNGDVTMTLHQVNQDGAGPYSCDVDASGAGLGTFQPMTMVKNVPGFLSLSFATATDFTMVAQMPAGATCTGGPNGDACVVRCKNKALAGPFGGCVAVTNAGSAANTTSTAASSDKRSEFHVFTPRKRSISEKSWNWMMATRVRRSRIGRMMA